MCYNECVLLCRSNLPCPIGINPGGGVGGVNVTGGALVVVITENNRNNLNENVE